MPQKSSSFKKHKYRYYLNPPSLAAAGDGRQPRAQLLPGRCPLPRSTPVKITKQVQMSSWSFMFAGADPQRDSSQQRRAPSRKAPAVSLPGSAHLPLTGWREELLVPGKVNDRIRQGYYQYYSCLCAVVSASLCFPSSFLSLPLIFHKQTTGRRTGGGGSPCKQQLLSTSVKRGAGRNNSPTSLSIHSRQGLICKASPSLPPPICNCLCLAEFLPGRIGLIWTKKGQEVSPLSRSERARLKALWALLPAAPQTFVPYQLSAKRRLFKVKISAAKVNGRLSTASRKAPEISLFL